SDRDGALLPAHDPEPRGRPRRRGQHRRRQRYGRHDRRSPARRGARGRCDPAALARATRAGRASRVDREGAGRRAPMPSLAEAVLLSAIIAAAGMMRGFSGFGFAMFAVPLMTVVMTPSRAVPIILALTFVSNLQTLRADWRDIDRRSVLWLVAWALPFV